MIIKYPTDTRTLCTAAGYKPHGMEFWRDRLNRCYEMGCNREQERFFRLLINVRKATAAFADWESFLRDFQGWMLEAYRQGQVDAGVFKSAIDTGGRQQTQAEDTTGSGTQEQ